MYQVAHKRFEDVDDALSYARLRVQRLYSGLGLEPPVGVLDLDVGVWVCVVTWDANGLQVQALNGWVYDPIAVCTWGLPAETPTAVVSEEEKEVHSGQV